MEIVFSDYSKNFIGHGFLAVDFFFCLSGFVIAYAYDGRIEKMGLVAFFRARLGAGARLTPGLKRLCVFSGKISYPLYLTHYAVLWMFGNYYGTHKPGTG
ncbi:MAG: hypothetical protein P4L51_08475 [Puia sp.]|nr:hypothetical protein [Puia sp.]